MTDNARLGECCACGATSAEIRWRGMGPLCDDCADRTVASAGMPHLPAAPGPVVLIDADGGEHQMRFQVSRTPVGVVVELREDRPHTDRGEVAEEGFVFGLLGDRDADVRTLAHAVSVEAAREVGHRYLEPDREGSGVQVAEDDVAGRFVSEPDGGPHRVVVDGRALSWHDFGHALSRFEGWRFHMIIEAPSIDVRFSARPGSRGEG